MMKNGYFEELSSYAKLVSLMRPSVWIIGFHKPCIGMFNTAAKGNDFWFAPVIHGLKDIRSENNLPV